jgi:hypothetical protein
LALATFQENTHLPFLQGKVTIVQKKFQSLASVSSMTSCHGHPIKVFFGTRLRAAICAFGPLLSAKLSGSSAACQTLPVTECNDAVEFEIEVSGHTARAQHIMIAKATNHSNPRSINHTNQLHHAIP